LLGDEFGNVTIWDLKVLIDKMEEISHDNEKMKIMKNKREQMLSDFAHRKNMNTDMSDLDPKKHKHSFITATQNPEFEFPGQHDLRIVMPARKLHNDGITHIEVIEEFKCFATSSFDCSVHIWTYEGVKLGSLILGRGMMQMNEKDDRMKWNFDISGKEKEIHEKNEKEATNLLDTLNKLSISESETKGLKDKKREKKRFQYVNEAAIKIHEAIQEKEIEEGKSEKSSVQSEESQKPVYDGKMDRKTRAVTDAKRVLDKYNQFSYEVTHPELMIGNMNDKEDYFGGDDDEDQDYQILQDLDFKSNNMNTVNKGIFKSKPFKSKIKAKLK